MSKKNNVKVFPTNMKRGYRIQIIVFKILILDYY